jgi:hypothetical protein
MEKGMLWFDADSNTDLVAKVRSAASNYRRKYGKSPTICFVGQNFTDPLPPERIDGIAIMINKVVEDNHLWIGQD